MTAITLQDAQYRLTRHYLDKLRTASQMLRVGRVSSVQYGLRVFDQEWAQIKQWQAWAANHASDDLEHIGMAQAFALDGYDALLIRLTLQERAEWLKAALAASRRTGDTKSECIVLFRLVSICKDLSALTEAEGFVGQLFERARASNDQLNIGRALYSQGLIFAQTGMNAEAQASYQQSLDIFEQHRADELMSAALWGLGTIANRLGRPQEGYEYFKRQLALTEAAGRVSEICSALNAVASGLTSLDDYSAAEVYARRCVALCRSVGYRQVLMSALFVVGECAMEQSHFDELLPPFEEALKIAYAIGHQRGIIHSLYCLGYAYLRMDNYARSISYLKEALESTRRINTPLMLETVLETLALVYVSKGDVDAAQPILHEALILAKQLDTEREKIRCLMSVVMLWHLKGLYEQAAIWAGLVADSTNLDEKFFLPVLAKLEAALGTEHYHSLLEQGKLLSLDTVVKQISAEFG